MPRMRRVVQTALSALVAGTAATCFAAPAAATPAAPGGATPDAPSGSVVPGANNWSCRPAAQHPRPVVLVPGTWESMAAAWSTLAPQLEHDGYCVYALNYGQDGGATRGADLGNDLGFYGGTDMVRSAGELSAFVDRVRTATGAQQVDLVGHSQGGTLARQYLRFNGGADLIDPARNKVHTVVMLGSPNHGTNFGGTEYLTAAAHLVGLPVYETMKDLVGPSVMQQMIGSTFLQALNTGSETDRGITYTAIASRSDTISTPASGTFLTAGPEAVVHNVWVQDGCDKEKVTHMELTSDPRATYLIQAALDPGYAATHPEPCTD